MKTQAFRQLDNLFVILNSATPTDEEWDEYVSAVRRFCEQAPANVLWKRLVFSDKGAVISAKQRKLLAEAAKDRPSVAAIVSDDEEMRRAITALAWQIAGPKAFASTETDAAFDHLRLDARERAMVKPLLAELRAELIKPSLRR